MAIKVQRAQGKYSHKGGPLVEYDILQIIEIAEEDGFTHGITIPKDQIVRVIEDIKQRFPELFC